MSELPSAYTIAEIPLDSQCMRYYPMRFGHWRRDARGFRISFGRREDAEAFCWNEQREYVTMYPTPAELAREALR